MRTMSGKNNANTRASVCSPAPQASISSHSRAKPRTNPASVTNVKSSVEFSIILVEQGEQPFPAYSIIQVMRAFAHGFGATATHNLVRQNLLGDYRTGGDHTATPQSGSMPNQGTTGHPYIVFNINRRRDRPKFGRLQIM